MENSWNKNSTLAFLEGGGGRITHNNLTSTNKGGNFSPANLTWLNLP